MFRPKCYYKNVCMDSETMSLRWQNISLVLYLEVKLMTIVRNVHRFKHRQQYSCWCIIGATTFKLIINVWVSAPWGWNIRKTPKCLESHTNCCCFMIWHDIRKQRAECIDIHIKNENYNFLGHLKCQWNTVALYHPVLHGQTKVLLQKCLYGQWDHVIVLAKH